MKVHVEGKIWDKEALIALYARNPQAVARALLVVYSNQTADEQTDKTTRHINGKGFTSHDAEWLTDIAKKWNVYGRWASEKQLAAVRRAIAKYHRQILDHMLDTREGAELVTAKMAKALEHGVDPDNANFGRF